jgi:undecaprenyl-diphosphatase
VIPDWISRVADADARALAWVARRRSDRLVRVMRAITRTGDASVVIMALATALFCGPSRAAVLVTVATIVGLGLFSIAKRLFVRARPASFFALLEAPDRFSFPSGHATCAWTIALTLSALVPSAATIAVPWALAVSASRVVLGVHYPLDVAAGAFLGIVASVTTIAIFG